MGSKGGKIDDVRKKVSVFLLTKDVFLSFRCHKMGETRFIFPQKRGFFFQEIRVSERMFPFSSMLSFIF